MTIRGFDAISAAKELHLLLGKYSEQSHRGFRLDVSVEDADELAVMDENLIFIDLDIDSLDMEGLAALSVALALLKSRASGVGQGDTMAAIVCKLMPPLFSRS